MDMVKARLRFPAAVVLAAIVTVGLARHVAASGPLGIYGIVDRVVFEPDERFPERVQVWGAFAYVDGASGPLATSPARRGYLYFTLPRFLARRSAQREGDDPGGESQIALIRREWADLKAVAGTGQAVGFGSWAYIGYFGGLQPDVRRSGPPYVLQAAPRGGEQTDLRVRPASETPVNPTAYQTNAGLVKLAERGSHASIVKQLRNAR
jgi:hypothetical protein